MAYEFILPEWDYQHSFGSTMEPSLHLLPQQTMLALGYLRNKRARVWRTKKSWLACFEGAHREGKSWAATLFAAILDDTFTDDMNGRIVHGHEAFIAKVKEFEARHIFGGVIICDEAGVLGNFSSSEWQKEWMAAINGIMQSFGYLHPIILFIAPDRSMIDSKTRRMFHTLHRVSRANNEFSVVKPHQLRWNQMRKKWDEISPVIKIGNVRIKMKHLRIRHYPKELGEKYKAIEQERKPIMLANLSQRVSTSKIQEAKKTYDVEALTNTVLERYHEFETKRSKPDNVILDYVKIKIKLGVPADYARYLKDSVEKKCNEGNK
jgi:hypothetical protein